LAAAALLMAWPMVGLSRLLNFGSSVPLLLALATALIFTIVSADRGFLQGLFRFGAYNASLLVESIGRIVVGLAVLRLVSRSATGALIGYVAAVVIAEAVNAAVLRDRREDHAPEAVDWPELRRLVLPMMMLMIAAAACQNLDMIAVKRWFSPDFAGQYGAASSLAKMFGVVFTPLYVLAGPLLTQHHERGETLTRPALRIAAIFVGISSAGLVLLLTRGEDVVRLLFGAAFTGQAWVAVHLGTVSVLLHTSLLLAQVFITMHDFRFLRWFALAAAVQIIGLAVFHATISQILATLYVAQLTLIIPVSVQLVRHARAHE
jgi:O-antigen/teichoic acid export membrane protein